MESTKKITEYFQSNEEADSKKNSLDKEIEQLFNADIENLSAEEDVSSSQDDTETTSYGCNEDISVENEFYEKDLLDKDSSASDDPSGTDDNDSSHKDYEYSSNSERNGYLSVEKDSTCSSDKKDSGASSDETDSDSSSDETNSDASSDETDNDDSSDKTGSHDSSDEKQSDEVSNEDRVSLDEESIFNSQEGNQIHVSLSEDEISALPSMNEKLECCVQSMNNLSVDHSKVSFYRRVELNNSSTEVIMIKLPKANKVVIKDIPVKVVIRIPNHDDREVQVEANEPLVLKDFPFKNIKIDTNSILVSSDTAYEEFDVRKDDENSKKDTHSIVITSAKSTSEKMITESSDQNVSIIAIWFPGLLASGTYGGLSWVNDISSSEEEKNNM